MLIASLETDSGLWGAALGVAYLLSYDFLFTAPLFTLKVLSRTDVAALAIFLVVSLIMGVITHRMSRQVQAAERTACALGRLNRLSVGLLESSTPQAACSFAQEFLTRVLRRPVTITLGEPPAAGSAAASARTTAQASPGTALVTTPPEMSRITGSAMGALVMHPS